MRRLEQLERVSVRIQQLDLLAAGTGFYLVSKANSGFLQRVDGSGEIGHLKHDAIPATRLLRLTVRHRARTRSPRSTERQREIADRNLRESRKVLSTGLEAKLLRIEAYGTIDILDLVADTVQARNGCGVRG